MKKKKTIIIILVITLVIFALLFLIYKNVFAGGKDSRNSDSLNNKLTNNEINSAKSMITENESVKSVDIHTNKNSKIVKIIVKLKEDVDLDEMKELANKTLTNFDESRLSDYDFEFYIDTESEESEIYPQIGYKFKSNSEFSW